MPLHNLNKDITEHEIGEYLTEKDKSTLALTSKTTQGLFQPHRTQMMVDKFLLLVTKGKQNQAEAIIKMHPEFLEITGTATDHYDRTFINTTAFKYSVWARDWGMIDMMRAYLPTSSQIRQLKELEDERQGITIKVKESLQEHQHYFDLSEYMAVLGVYVKNYAIWDYARCKAFSHHDIGTRQRALPISILQYIYFNPECERWSFHEDPKFYEKKLERRNSFYNAVTTKNQNWDEAINPSSSHQIGNNMVVYWVYDMKRSGAGIATGVSSSAIGRGADWDAGSPIHAGGRDLKLLIAFDIASRVKFQKFKQELKDLNQKTNCQDVGLNDRNGVKAK